MDTTALGGAALRMRLLELYLPHGAAEALERARGAEAWILGSVASPADVPADAGARTARSRRVKAPAAPATEPAEPAVPATDSEPPGAAALRIQLKRDDRHRLIWCTATCAELARLCGEGHALETLAALFGLQPAGMQVRISKQGLTAAWRAAQQAAAPEPPPEPEIEPAPEPAPIAAEPDLSGLGLHARRVYALYAAAADEGRPSPSNEDLFHHAELPAHSYAGEATIELEKAGLIRVERGPNWRRVTVVATGRSTLPSDRSRRSGRAVDPDASRNVRPAQRTCLRCRDTFFSQGPHNRMCPACVQASAGELEGVP